ncbi:hypothetical protein ACQF36_36975 [Streptomyces sp. Marseille-Q5077]
MLDEWIAFPRRYFREGSTDELSRELPACAPGATNTTDLTAS